MGDRAIIPRLAPATLVVSLLAVMLLKVWLMQPAALGPLWQPLLHHDAAIFGLVLAALAIVAALRQRTGMLAAVARRVAAAAMALLIVLYCVDAFVYWFFASRLYVSDVITFSSELSAAWSLLKSAYWIALNAPWVTLGCLVVGAVVTWSFLATVSARDGQQLPPRWLASASAIGLLIYGLELHAETKFYGDKPLYENFVERNWAFFRDGSFSAAHRAQLKSLVEATDCRPGHGQQLSIVLLIVESLSAYHSKYFSGVQDWTPHLDRIASLETALTNFHANGWTTIGGLISTLSGQFPMVPERGHFNEWGSPRLADFPVARRPIAKRLREAGYNTSFVAAGDVNFLDQRPWLRDIGFESVIGHTDPRMAYDGVRGPFSSVPDKVLYRVAMDELRQLRAAGAPFFLAIQTYWSHRPFLSQNGAKVDGEERVIREADSEIGAFYDELLKSGFLGEGLVFITGDHRAMEPPTSEGEKLRFGSSWVSRIPGVVASRAVQLPKVIEADFQQSDVAASFESLVLPQYCVGELEGSFLATPPSPSPCILHAKGDDRDLVLVKCGPHDAVVRLDGDRTGIESGRVPNQTRLIQLINRTRIRDRSR